MKEPVGEFRTPPAPEQEQNRGLSREKASRAITTRWDSSWVQMDEDEEEEEEERDEDSAFIIYSNLKQTFLFKNKPQNSFRKCFFVVNYGMNSFNSTISHFFF